MDKGEETSPTATQRPGRGRPKLRSSCDGCGAAKVKCDRGQPKCGRCVSYAMPCVYGPLQRMGKPPRQGRGPGPQNQQPKEASFVVGPGGETAGPSFGSVAESKTAWWDLNLFWETQHQGVNNGIITDGNVNSGRPGPVPVPYFDYDDCADQIQIQGGNNGIIADDSVDPGRPLTYFDYDDCAAATSQEHEGAASMTNELSPNLLAASSSAPGSAAARPPGPEPTESPRSHECLAEAREILATLPVLDIYSHQSVALPLSSSSPSPSSSSSAPSSVKFDMGESRVPLDHVLSLNRVACERLARLLSCSCARLPHVILLYASIISRMLSWYQHAAMCTRDPSWNAGTANPAPTGPALPGPNHLPAFKSTSSSSVTAWSTTNLGNRSSTSPTCIRAQDAVHGGFSKVVSPLASTPAGDMAIGTFYVDDLRVKSAVKVQVLLGEMRRTHRLIEQISSQPSGDRRPSSESSSPDASFDGLYRNLQSWLRSEHAGILDMMLSKLRELNS